MQRTLTASQLCSVNPSSFCLTLFNCEHHFSALLRPSLLFSILTALFNSSQSLFHLFPPQLNSFHLFPTLLNDSHLCPPFLNSSHLLPPLLNSSHLFSPALNSSHLFLSSSQPFSPLVNSSQLLRTEAFSQRSFYTQKLLHTASFYTEKLLHRMRQNGQKNLLPKHRSQPSCSYYNTIYDSQLLSIKVFRAQLQQRGTLTQPFHCDLLTLSCKFKQNDAPRLQKWQLQNQISTPKRKKHDLEALFERILLKENHLRQNGEKSAA